MPWRTYQRSISIRSSAGPRARRRRSLRAELPDLRHELGEEVFEAVIGTFYRAGGHLL